jgi:hypothetical protein
MSEGYLPIHACVRIDIYIYDVCMYMYYIYIYGEGEREYQSGEGIKLSGSHTFSNEYLQNDIVDHSLTL